LFKRDFVGRSEGTIATKRGAVASDTEQDNVVDHREKIKIKIKIKIVVRTLTACLNFLYWIRQLVLEIRQENQSTEGMTISVPHSWGINQSITWIPISMSMTRSMESANIFAHV